MDKERIKQLAENANFIPGIYNYCDRWCERCPFTDRCMNFAMSREEFPDPASRDVDNDAFREKLSETFQATIELLQEMAVEDGIDIEDLDIEEAREEEIQREEAARKHEITMAAEEYADGVDAWLKSADALFAEKTEQLMLEARLNIPEVLPEKEAAVLKDAVEVIRWYQHQIFVKLMRAVRGEMDERPAMLEGYPRDADGSAKVALIGMDRSIAAWGEIHKAFPDSEDEVLDILVRLARLRTRTEAQFPNARAFVRPGFDDRQ